MGVRLTANNMHLHPPPLKPYQDNNITFFLSLSSSATTQLIHFLFLPFFICTLCNCIHFAGRRQCNASKKWMRHQRIMDGGASAMLLRVMCPLKKIGYVLGNFLEGEEGGCGFNGGNVRSAEEDDAWLPHGMRKLGQVVDEQDRTHEGHACLELSIHPQPTKPPPPPSIHIFREWERETKRMPTSWWERALLCSRHRHAH